MLRIFTLLMILFSITLFARNKSMIGLEDKKQKILSHQPKVTPKPKNDYGDWGDDPISGPLSNFFNQYSEKHNRLLLFKAKEIYMDVLEAKQIDEYNMGKIRRKWQEEDTVKRFEWQVKDDKRKKERYIKRLQQKSELKAVNNLIVSIKLIDKIKNLKLKKSGEYLSIKSNIFREYVKSQYYLKNLSQCILILEKYLTIRQENKKDIKAQEILVDCYTHKEKIASRNSGKLSQAALFFNGKKRHHLLNLTALKFGSSSKEYHELMQKLERDNIITVN